MEKIISLIMAGFMACSCYGGSYEKPKLDENEMRVSIVNETEDAVLGFGMDYVIDGVNAGGSGGMVANPMNKGEEIDLELDLDKYDLEDKESFDFAMTLKAYLEDETTVNLDSYAQWEAEPQGDYEFVVSGSQDKGYKLTAKDADFDCTIAPMDKLGDNEMRVTIVNETEDAISGFGMDYVIDGVNAGGSGGMVDGTMSKGEEIDFDLMLDHYDLEDKESFDFAMILKAYLEDGTTVNLDSYAQWNAEAQGEYKFVVSGSKDKGYKLTAKDADFDCTIAPMDKLGDNEMRVTIVNETEDAVSGFGIEYTIDGVRAGGGNGKVADGGTMNKGEEIDFDLMLDHYDLEDKENFPFGMSVKVYLEDGTTTYVDFYAKWDAELQNEYEFVVSGSKDKGYELTVRDADFDCTIAPVVG